MQFKTRYSVVCGVTKTPSRCAMRTMDANLAQRDMALSGRNQAGLAGEEQ